MSKHNEMKIKVKIEHITRYIIIWRLDYHIRRTVSLLRFIDSIFHVHPFVFSFSHFLSSSFIQPFSMYTYICTFIYIYIYIYIYTYRHIVICICVARKKKNVHLCTSMYSHDIFPLKTLRTIGSILNVFYFMYNIIGLSSSSLYNLGSDTCARLVSLRLQMTLSCFRSLFFLALPSVI